MPEVETIQIHYKDQSKGKGIFQINAADFDPEVHKRLTDKEETAVEKAADLATAKAEKAAEKEAKK